MTGVIPGYKHLLLEQHGTVDATLDDSMADCVQGDENGMVCCDKSRDDDVIAVSVIKITQ